MQQLYVIFYFRSSYKEVHVRLGDLNDHWPVFEQEEFHVNIPENALVNTPITKLKVSRNISVTKNKSDSSARFHLFLQNTTILLDTLHE